MRSAQRITPLESDRTIDFAEKNNSLTKLGVISTNQEKNCFTVTEYILTGPGNHATTKSKKELFTRKRGRN